jgi:hypothetical protein
VCPEVSRAELEGLAKLLCGLAPLALDVPFVADQEMVLRVQGRRVQVPRHLLGFRGTSLVSEKVPIACLRQVDGAGPHAENCGTV